MPKLTHDHRPVLRVSAAARGIILALALEPEEDSPRTTDEWAALLHISPVAFAGVIDSLEDLGLIDHEEGPCYRLRLTGAAARFAGALRSALGAPESASQRSDDAPGHGLRTEMSIRPDKETAFLMRERARQRAYRERRKALRSAAESAAESAAGSASQRCSPPVPPSSSFQRSTLAPTTTTTPRVARNAGGGGGGSAGDRADVEEALREAGVSRKVRAELSARLPLGLVRERIRAANAAGTRAGGLVEDLRDISEAQIEAWRAQCEEREQRAGHLRAMRDLDALLRLLRTLPRLNAAAWDDLVRAYLAASAGREEGATREVQELAEPFVRFAAAQPHIRRRLEAP